LVISTKIREALAQAPDGLTTRELALKLNVQQSSVTHSLKKMHDTYIDRWQKTATKYAAVYCLAFVPDDCPHP